MKKQGSIILALASIVMPLVGSTTVNVENTCQTKYSQNLWQPRAYNSYTSEDLLRFKNLYMHEQRNEHWTGILSSSVAYMQNIQGKSSGRLASLPFWSGTNSMTYGTNDGKSNIDAYQFGMGDVEGQGTIQMCPQIRHVCGDMLLYVAYDKQKPGCYFKLNVPIDSLSIQTNLSEIVAGPNVTADQATNDAWYTYPSQANMYQSLTEAWQGGSVSSLPSVNSSEHKPFTLNRGRFYVGKDTKTRVGDISVTVGYNFIARENGLLGLGAKVYCPTGNVPSGQFIFEPMTGKAGHLAVGGELIGHYRCYENDAQTHRVDFWIEGEALHLTTGRTPAFRSFDLKQNGLGSKYLLLQYYFAGDPIGASNSQVPPFPANPTGRVPSFITQAVNVTTMPVISTFAVEGSITALVDFTCHNWNFAIGAEYWGRSKENLSLDCNNLVNTSAVNLNDFAVLGRQISDDASLYNPTNLVTIDNYIAQITLCEPLATINSSQDRVDVTGLNPVVLAAYDTTKIKDARIATNRIPADLNEALDICGAAVMRAMTVRVFGQLGYDFKDHKYPVNLSLIGGAEFVTGCTNNMVNMWSAGALLSVNF